jgi:hypothetical protein
MSNGIRRVHLGELASALDEIAKWTQAVQAELLTCKVAGNMPTTLDEVIEAVATAVDSTATAAARAKVADAALTTYPSGGAAKKHDLQTNLSNAETQLKTFVDATITGLSPSTVSPTTAAAAAGAILGRGC